MMLLIERSEYDDDVAQSVDDDDVADRKVKVLLTMMFLIEEDYNTNDKVVDQMIKVLLLLKLKMKTIYQR